MARDTEVTHEILVTKTDGSTVVERWHNPVMGGRPTKARLSAMSAKVPTIAAAQLREIGGRVVAEWKR